MKRIFISISIVGILLLIAACNSREKEEKKADEKLLQIQKLITENKLNEAKAEIDSIHILFPKLVNKRKQAVILNDSIILRESKRTVKFTEKVIPKIKASIEKLEKEFIFSKNEKYEEFGKYVYKSHVAELNNGRTFLKCEVDENRDIFLTSQYCGSKLNQYAVKAEASGLNVSTDLTNKSTGTFHSFIIDKNNIEQLTFKNEDDGGIVQFIKENELMNIKITLVGDRNYSYELSSKDKEAISKTYTFALAYKLLKKSENDLRIAQQRIGKINLLYNN